MAGGRIGQWVLAKCITFARFLKFISIYSYFLNQYKISDLCNLWSCILQLHIIFFRFMVDPFSYPSCEPCIMSQFLLESPLKRCPIHFICKNIDEGISECWTPIKDVSWNWDSYRFGQDTLKFNYVTSALCQFLPIVPEISKDFKSFREILKYLEQF